MNWIRSRIVSFGNAFSGITFNIRNETNFIIQVIVALLVVAAGFLFKITRTEWALIVVAITIVLVTEVINTAIERVCDRFYKEKDAEVKIIKDSAAAAVLIASLASIVIGLLVFWPYLF